MKLRRSFLFFLLALVPLVPSAANRPGFVLGKKRVHPKYVEGEVVVKFARHFTAESNRLHLRDHYHARAARAISNSGLTHVKLPAGQSVEDAVRELSKDGSVEFVEPNYLGQLLTVPNDPLYGQQWALKNTKQTIATGSIAGNNASSISATNNPPATSYDVDLETAWGINTDCSSVIVAVIDSGVNYNHADLAANMWTDASFPKNGYDFYESDNDPMDGLIDTSGHGTHVAGIIGAVGNNGIGTSGVCWTAKIMAVRAGTSSLSSANVASAISFAVSHGAKVINLSIGFSGAAPAAVQTAISDAVARDVLPVAAAGNDGSNNDSTPVYPCNFSGVLCVASLDQNASLSSFSNYGATTVHVAAPGRNILSLANASFATIGSSYPDALTAASGWTLPASWANASVSGTNSLVLPSNYNGTTNNYTASLDARAYKTFNLSAYSDALAFANIKVASEASGDMLYAGSSRSGGEPFANNGNVATDFESNSTGDTYSSLSGTLSDDQYLISLTGCMTSTCTFGFAFQSNANGTVGTGVQVHDLGIYAASASTTNYRVISGTSMATPVVAGIAALVWAYNPRYSATEVATAIKNGGVSVLSAGDAAKVSSGKAVSAAGALKYNAAPVNVVTSVR